MTGKYLFFHSEIRDYYLRFPAVANQSFMAARRDWCPICHNWPFVGEIAPSVAGRDRQKKRAFASQSKHNRK